MFIDGGEYTCPAGTFIFVPAGMPHGFRVGATPSRKLNFYFPAAMIGYFDELSAAIRAGDVEDDALDDIARRHKMEIVGPVPESYV
jgi:AraC-like ligand binding domain